MLTIRSIRLLQTEGWKVITPSKIPQRLWGFADVLATKGPPIKVKLVCVVDSQYVCGHVHEVLEHKHVKDLLMMGWEIEVHGWVKQYSERYSPRKGEFWEVVRKEVV